MHLSINVMNQKFVETRCANQSTIPAKSGTNGRSGSGPMPGRRSGSCGQLLARHAKAILDRSCRVLAARHNAGVAAIEFAIYGLVFTMIVAAVGDIGLLLFTASELDAAVSAGAQYAVNNAAMVASNPSTLSTNISDIVNGAIGSGWATSTVNVNNSNDSTHCYCPTGTPGNWSWGSTVTCGSTCSGGGVGGQFVTITASRSVSPLFPTFGFVQSGTLTRNALVETE
jgi:Flp pilus assembly protein TadG